MKSEQIKTGTTPPVPNKQARHTVEFSKDTRTPTSHRQAVRRGLSCRVASRTESGATPPP